MNPKRLCGYIRLACAVAEYSAAQTKRVLEPLAEATLYEVSLPNRRYTGPLVGEWFEDGIAQVGEEAAERFRLQGYTVRRLS